MNRSTSCSLGGALGSRQIQLGTMGCMVWRSVLVLFLCGAYITVALPLNASTQLNLLMEEDQHPNNKTELSCK